MNLKTIQKVKILYLISYCVAIVIGIIYLLSSLVNFFFILVEIIFLVDFIYYVHLLAILMSFVFYCCSLIYLSKLKIKRAILLGIYGDIAVVILLSLLDYLDRDYLQSALIFFLLVIFIINFSIVILKSREDIKKERTKVKNTILDLGSNYTKISIRDISSLCNVDVQNVEMIIVELIRNKEIEVYYDKKKLFLNYEIELDEKYIDRLISKFEDWELEKEDKK